MRSLGSHAYVICEKTGFEELFHPLTWFLYQLLAASYTAVIANKVYVATDVVSTFANNMSYARCYRFAAVLETTRLELVFLHT